MYTKISKRTLKLGAILAVIVGIYAAFTLGQAVIHSDSTTGNLYMNSIIANRSLFPRTWNYYNSEIYSISTITVSAITHVLIPNAIIARVLASVITLLVACVSTIWFSKKILNDESYILVLPALFVFACEHTYRDLFYFQAENVINLIIFTLCYGLAYKVFIDEEKRLKYIIPHSVLLFLLMMDTLRSVAEFLLPLLVVIFIKWIIIVKKKNWSELKNNAISFFLYIIIPSVTGWGLYKYVESTHHGHMHSSGSNSVNLIFSVEVLVSNICTTFLNLFASFGYDKEEIFIRNIVAIIMAVMLFIVIPILQVLDFKRLGKSEKIFLCFGLMHNIILLGAIIGLGKLYGRYLASSIFIAVMISANYIMRRIISRDRFSAFVVTIVFFILVCVYSVNLFKTTIGWSDLVETRKNVCQTLIDKGITKGYASYWIAYPNEIYSNNQLTFGALTISPRTLQRFYHLSDDRAYDKKEGRSCVIMTQEEAGECGNAIYNVLGVQDEDFVIEDAYVSDGDKFYNTNLIVYVFNEDIGYKIPDDFRDGILGLNEVDFNWYGTITKDAIILEKDGLVHGPNSDLDKGNYLVRIVGKNLVGCNCAIISNNTPENVYTLVTDIQEDHIDINLSLKASVEDLQIYLSNPMDDKTAIFNYILISQIE